jgi:hypothetical protein
MRRIAARSRLMRRMEHVAVAARERLKAIAAYESLSLDLQTRFAGTSSEVIFANVTRFGASAFVTRAPARSP